MVVGKKKEPKDSIRHVTMTGLTTPKSARPTKDYDAGDLTGPNFVDHFSLREPSSCVKFRGARVHVYETFNEQILLEDRLSSKDIHGNFIFDDETDDDDDDNGKSKPMRRHNITVKRMPWTSFGLCVLRLAYTLVSLLLFGYAFTLSFQIILFLFVRLASEGKGVVDLAEGNEESSDWGLPSYALISTVLSTPVFLYGFSSLMALNSTFVSEAWSGGHLIRGVIGAPSLFKEILYFFCFIFVPVMTFIVSLFLRIEEPWEYACYAWLTAAAFLFFCFSFAIVWCEVAACFRLMSIHYSEEDTEAELSPFRRFLRQVRRAVLLVQTQKYSGNQNEQYYVTGDCVAPEGGFTFSEKHSPTATSRSLYSRMTELGCLQCMFETIEKPERTYNIAEVRDVLPFLTTHTWSLETMFCLNNRSQKIVAAKGPSALKPAQIMSSTVCNVLGTLIMIATVIAFMFWLGTGLKSYIFVAVLGTLSCLLPMVQSSMKMIKFYKDLNCKGAEIPDVEKSGEGAPEEEDIKKPDVACQEETMYRLWETSRVTKPKIWVCYTGMALEIICLFAVPVSQLFYIRNYPTGIIFVILSFFSFVRKYFDASAILCELGSMDGIDVELTPGKGRDGRALFRRQSTFHGIDRTLVKKARLSDIVGYVSRSDTVTSWMYFFGSLVIFTLFLYSMAVASGDGLGERPPIILVDDYAYPAEESLQYPTCAMSKGFQIDLNEISADTHLGDYAFLSAMAYETTNVTDYILPQYFGAEGTVVDEDELVANYREEVGNSKTPVFFKLFTVPANPDVAVIAIRGSQTAWDWMVNFQLWSSSGNAQIVKWLIPYGWIWSPILDDLVWFMSFLQTEQLDEVSYYRVTTAFANEFKQTYKNLVVTGASLGGGLATITGAQARIPAVAISGLGAEFSRNALNPRVTMDDIHKYVFNFMPDRDYIARVGGRPRQHQEAECIATKSDLFGCHSMWRSVCEINYRCGSNGRPVMCRCHFNFGYPEPEPIGNTTRSFRDACLEEEEAFLSGTGSTIRAKWW